MCSTTPGRSRTGVNDPAVGIQGSLVGVYSSMVSAYGSASGVHGSAVAGEVAFPAWTWMTSTPSACPAMWHA